MDSKMSFSATASFALVIAMAVPSVAAADELGNAPPQMQVKFSDLNTTTESGANILYKRLETAAANVCEKYDSYDPIYRLGWRACFEKSLADAVLKINQDRVTKAYLTQHDAKEARHYGIHDSIRLAGK